VVLLLDGIGALPVRRVLALAALKSASSASSASSVPPVMGKLPTSALDSLPRRRSILVSHLTLEFASEQLTSECIPKRPSLAKNVRITPVWHDIRKSLNHLLGSRNRTCS
jgi:hypothetical protein